MDTKFLRPTDRRQYRRDGQRPSRQSQSWRSHLRSGEATVDDLLALRHWRQRSPRHEAAWREMVCWWEILGVALREYAARHPEENSFVFLSHARDDLCSRRRLMH